MSCLTNRVSMPKCGTYNLTSKIMKAVLIISLFFCLSLSANVKESMERVRNELQLELTKTRLKVIKADGDLNTLFNNILRTHEKLERILLRHPEMIKNANLKEPKLSQLKLKLINEDEDLIDMKKVLIRLHRKLEDALEKKPEIKSLMQRLDSINNRLQKL